MTKQEAMRLAVMTGRVAMESINRSGPNSPQSRSAVKAANEAWATAQSLGVTKADLKAAKGR